MNRRHFIIIGAAGVAAVSIPTTYYFFKSVDYNPLLAQPQLLSLIWDNETMKYVGNQYRLQFSSEKSTKSLVRMLEGAVSHLEESIKNDFETGNTVIVDGWILSRTEARQCALLSTINPK